MSAAVEYGEFLASKAPVPTTYGHPVEPGDVNPILKPHQREIVRWCVDGGRRAIFAAFGLGKRALSAPTLFDLEAATA